MSTRSSRPSIAELRAATQPPSLFARNSGEHWAGRLYVRRLSPYATRMLLGLHPNTVTAFMVVAGLAAAAVIALDGVLPVVAALVLIQLQILLDCSDGEVARWRGISSPVGIYLDRIAHWFTETALPIGWGIHTDHVELGLIAAVLQLLIKGEAALVAVARLEAGLGKVADTAEAVASRQSLLRTLRRLAGAAPFYRVFVAVEFTMLALIAELTGLQEEFLWLLVGAGAVTAAMRLVAILTSDRLR